MTDEQNDRTSAAAAVEGPSYTVRKREYTRWWEVRDSADELCTGAERGRWCVA